MWTFPFVDCHRVRRHVRQRWFLSVDPAHHGATSVRLHLVGLFGGWRLSLQRSSRAVICLPPALLPLAVGRGLGPNDANVATEPARAIGESADFSYRPA